MSTLVQRTGNPLNKSLNEQLKMDVVDCPTVLESSKDVRTEITRLSSGGFTSPMAVLGKV
jgi:hypothetical protein